MKQFNPSATGAIQAIAHQMRKSGIHVYNFGTGDPVLANHPEILRAAEKNLQHKMNPYAPFAGLTELRIAAAEWMNRRYASSFDLAQSVVTCGGKFAIYASLQILVEPGDEVLVPAPYWVSYPEMIQMAAGRLVPIPTAQSSGWKMTPQDLLSHCTERSRVLILNNACNPTGVLYTKKELAEILKAARDRNLWVLSDEVYSELVFDGSEFISCASFPEHAPHVIIVESCSKNFAMAGWRVGFAFGPPSIISNIIALQSQSTSGTALISQQAAMGAILNFKEVSSYVREAMKARRDLFFKIYNHLFKTSHQPGSAAIYFFAPIGPDSIKKCKEILEKAHVALVPGIGFGVEGYARFAFSEEEDQIEQGLIALKKNLGERI